MFSPELPGLEFMYFYHHQLKCSLKVNSCVQPFFFPALLMDSKAESYMNACSGLTSSGVPLNDGCLCRNHREKVERNITLHILCATLSPMHIVFLRHIPMSAFQKSEFWAELCRLPKTPPPFFFLQTLLFIKPLRFKMAGLLSNTMYFSLGMDKSL